MLKVWPFYFSQSSYSVQQRPFFFTPERQNRAGAKPSLITMETSKVHILQRFVLILTLVTLAPNNLRIFKLLYLKLNYVQFV